jgi:hypothetical protein
LATISPSEYGTLARLSPGSRKNLGCAQRRLPPKIFDAFLEFSKDDEIGLALVVIPAGQTTVNVERHPILFSKKLEACREEFASRGIQVAPLQRDSGGNSFFKFRDAEDNIIEVCNEP